MSIVVSEIETPHLALLLAGHNECPFCHYVYPQISTTHGIPCPSCNVPIDVQQGYFSLTAYVLIDLMQEYYHLERQPQNDNLSKYDESDNHKLAVIIFFCSLGEVLLHHFLQKLMIARDIPSSVCERLLDDNRYYKVRVDKLFPSLTDDKWKTAIRKANEGKEIDYQKTSDFYSKVCNVRNILLHRGNVFAVNKSMPEECINQIQHLINLFVSLHNYYIPSIYKKKGGLKT